jgi:hypothetical protein
MTLGFNFLRDKSSVLKHAATATLQQAVALMFDRAETELSIITTGKAVTSNINTESLLDVDSLKAPEATVITACRLFLQDMVLIAGGLPTQWMRKGTPVPRVLAADLIDYAVREHALMFHKLPEMRFVAVQLLVPLLMRQLPTQLSFPLLLRFFRITRSAILGLHSAVPVLCRALLSLLVRMVHACAKGEDLGADSAQKLGRFGAAGARILNRGHRALGAASSLAEPTSPVPSGKEVAEVTDGSQVPADEAGIMAAVAAVSLGPMPLFKCILLMETLVSVTSRPNLLYTLYVQNDMRDIETLRSREEGASMTTASFKTPIRLIRASASESPVGSGGGGGTGGGDGSLRVVEHVVEALCSLIYRILVLHNNNSDMSLSYNNVDSTPNDNKNGKGVDTASKQQRQMRARRSMSGADTVFEDGASRQSISSAGGVSLASSGDELGQDGIGEDEFSIAYLDIDIAVEMYSKRPLANLVIPDADTHIFTSSAGGIGAAIAAAPKEQSSNGAPNSGSTISLAGAATAIASMTVGAAFSLMSAGINAASKGMGGDRASSEYTDSLSAATLTIDSVGPSSELHAATLVVLACEGIVNYISAISLCVKDCALANISATLLSGADVARIQSESSALSASGLVSPDLRVPSKVFSQQQDRTGNSTSSNSTTTTSAAVSAQKKGVDIIDSVKISYRHDVAKEMTIGSYRGMAQALCTLFEATDAPFVSAFILRALQALTFSCGALGLSAPRDSLLVIICRLVLPVWDPSPGVGHVAVNLLGDRHGAGASLASSQYDTLERLRRRTHKSNALEVKHALALRCLFNLVNGLGGVLRSSWIVLIDTFEHYGRFLDLSNDSGAAESIDAELPSDSQSPEGSLLTLPRIYSMCTTDGVPLSQGERSNVILGISSVEYTLEIPTSSSNAMNRRSITENIDVTSTGDVSVALVGENETDLIDSSISRSRDRYSTNFESSFGGSIFLSATIRSLFENTKRLNASALTELVQTLSELTVTAFAESATAALEFSPSSPASSSSAQLGGSGQSEGSNTPSTPSSDPPFALMRLLDTCAHNVHRLNVVWGPLSGLMRVLARSPNQSVRRYGISRLTDLIISHLLQTATLQSSLSKSDSVDSTGPPTSGENRQASINPVVPRDVLLNPLCDYWRSPHPSSRTDCLRSLYRIIEEAGSCLVRSSGRRGETPLANSDAWSTCIGLLLQTAYIAIGVDESQASESGSICNASKSSIGAATGLFSSNLPTYLFEHADRHASSLSQQHRQLLLSEAFRSIQLISDDFLDSIPSSDLSFLVLVLGMCVRQSVEMNLRLTSIGLLWKLGDRLARMRAMGALTVSAYESLWRQLFSLLISVANSSEYIVLPSGSVSPDGSTSIALREVFVPSSRSQGTTGASAVGERSNDEAEVRNSAVQALFSCLTAHVNVMGDSLWSEFFHEHVLDLLYEITTVAQLHLAEDSAVVGESVGRRRGAADEGEDGNVRLLLHHSRDTIGKQWNETRIVAYQCTARTISACFGKLANYSWFFDAWTDVLVILERSVAGRHRGQNIGSGTKDRSSGTGVAGAGSPSARSRLQQSPFELSPESPQTSPSIFLEPADVSVAAMSCLQELALLVCVPAGPGRPVDDEDGRYSFDMRVVDGALVRVANENSSSSETPSSSTESDESSHSNLALRDRMWQDVRSVLNGVVGCAAVTVEEEETVAVSVIDALLAIATAAVDSSYSSQVLSGRAKSVIEEPKRFTDTLSMMWSVLDSRRRYRWAQCNSQAVTSGMKLAAEELQGPKTDSPTNAERAVLRSLERLAGSFRSVAARIDAQKREATLSAAILDPISSAWAVLIDFVRRCSVLDEGVYAVEFVRGAELPAVALAGITKSLRATAAAAPTGSASIELALPPSALAVNTLKLFQRIYTVGSTIASSSSSQGKSDGKDSSVGMKSPSQVRRIGPIGSAPPSAAQIAIEEAANANEKRVQVAVQACLDSVLQRSFSSTVTLLAQALMHSRELSDRASSEQDSSDVGISASGALPVQSSSKTVSAESIANPRSRRRGGRSLALDEACVSAGLTGLQITSASALKKSIQRENIYPIKIWGFGLGGSYGKAGDGSFFIADGAKTKRQITRSKQYCESLMSTLVAVIRHRLSSAGVGSVKSVDAADSHNLPASSDSLTALSSTSSSAAIDMWLSLTSTLEVLVGFSSPSTSLGGLGSGGIGIGSAAAAGLSGLSTPAKARGPTDSYASISRFFEGIIADLDSDTQLLLRTNCFGNVVKYGSNSIDSNDVDALLRFDHCHSQLDAGLWATVARVYRAAMSTTAPNTVSTSSSTSAGPQTGSPISQSVHAFDSLRGFIGPSGAVTQSLLGPVLKSRTYASATRFLGWTTLWHALSLKSTSSTSTFSGSSETESLSAAELAGPVTVLDAEVFLLSALIDGYFSLLKSDATATTYGFIELTKRLFTLLVAGVSVLGVLVDGEITPKPLSDSSNTVDSTLEASIAEIERRRRAFGRICFGALVQLSIADTQGLSTLAVIGSGSPNISSAFSGKDNSESNAGVASACASEVRAFSSRLVLHTACRLLHLHSMVEGGMAQARTWHKASRGASSSGGQNSSAVAPLLLMPCGGLVIDASYALSALSQLIEVEKTAASSESDSAYRIDKLSLKLVHRALIASVAVSEPLLRYQVQSILLQLDM